MIFHWFLTMVGCNRRKSSSNILTEAEVTAIKEVWSKAKKREVGQKILRALIDHKPQFKDYFGIHVSENNLEELYACKEFQVQAHRVQNFLDTAVSTLGFCPISNVHAMAHRIGQIHFYRGVNFGADNWLAFKKVTVDQVTAELSQREIGNTHGEKQWSRKGSLLDIGQAYSGPCLAVVGWEKFMSSIVKEMKRGFLDEARRNCTEEDPLD